MNENSSNNKIDVGHIYRSFQNSPRRKEVYYYLYSIRPKKLTVTEISKATKIRKATVSGALKGSGKRYSEKDSLVGLSLIADGYETNHGRIEYVYGVAHPDLDVKKILDDYNLLMDLNRVHGYKKIIVEI